jgi:hypothetical protein
MRLLAAGKVVECADLSFRVLELAQAAGDQAMVMGLHGGLGACFHKMGKYSSALEHAQHQLAIAQVLDLQLGQAQAKNGIALELTELGDMEGSRRNLEEALQHCYNVKPAGRELVQKQSFLFLCTTLANLAEHSVRVGQFKDAMLWVRKLEHVDTEYIDPHSQQVWAARAAGILESIHKKLGTSPMHNTEMPDRNDVEEMQASNFKGPKRRALHLTCISKIYVSDKPQGLAEQARAAGNITRMCEILEAAARKCMEDTHDFDTAIFCLTTSSAARRKCDSKPHLATCLMLLGI